jgi:hypothetical protein
MPLCKQDLTHRAPCSGWSKMLQRYSALSADVPATAYSLAECLPPWKRSFCSSTLRRSREMTILCSPKVTQHHDQVNGPFAACKAVFASGQITCAPGLATPRAVDLFQRHRDVSSQTEHFTRLVLSNQGRTIHTVVAEFTPPGATVPVLGTTRSDGFKVGGDN